MAVELATAYVSLVPSAAGIAQGIASEMGGPLEAAAKASGDKASKSFGSTFATGLKNAAKLATVGLGAAVAGGIGLEKIGASFDSAFDSIRIKTGETGTALAGLQQNFKDVVTSVPVSFGDASAAIAGLNQKLGLTGKPLEDLSTQVLNLSRITGTDLSTNIDAVTGLFNSWGVAAKDQGPKLDELFRISQQTGISVGDLATQMASGGTAFRQAGLSYESTGALLGLLAKNGLDAGDVIPALSKALATAAKEGKPASQVFADTFNSIKNAPNDTKAAGIALDVFGAKAGPKFATLIREGKLSYEDFAKAIAAGGDTINNAAADTDDWREKLKVLVNKGLVLIAPIAAKVFGGITTLIEKATPWLSKFAGWLGREIPAAAAVVANWFTSHVVPAFQAVSGWVSDHWPQISKIATDVFDAIKNAVSYFVDVIVPKIVDGFKKTFGFLMDHKEILIGVAAALAVGLTALFVSWAAGALSAAAATVAAAAPFIAIGLAIAAVVAGVIYAYKHWQTFHDVVDAIGRWFRDVFWPDLKIVFNWLKDNVPPILDAIGRWFRDKLWPIIKTVARDIGDAIGALVGWIRDHWAQIKADALAVINWFNDYVVQTYIKIYTAIGQGIEWLVRWIRDHWDTIKADALAVINWFNTYVVQTYVKIYTAMGEGIAWLVRWISDHWDQITADVMNTVHVIEAIFKGLYTAVKVQIQAVVDVIEFIWNHFGTDIVQLVQDIWNVVKGVFQVAWDAIKGAFQAALDIIRGTFEVFKNLFTGDWSGAWNGVKDILTGIWEAIKTVVQLAVDSIGLILSAAWAAIQLAVSVAWDAIKVVLQGVWDGIKLLIEGYIAALELILSTAWGLITSAASAAWNGIKTIAGTVWDGIKTAIMTPINALAGLISAVWTTITNGVNTAWNGIKSFISGVWDGITTIVSGAVDGIESILSGVWTNVANTVTGIWNGILATVKGVIGDIKGFLSGIWDGVGDGLHSVLHGIVVVINGFISAYNAIPIIPDIDPIKGFAAGGIVPGRGIGDTVPAMLTPGEMVLNASQQANMFSLLNGAMIGSGSASQWPDTMTLIVEGEPITARIRQNNHEVASAIRAGQRR